MSADSKVHLKREKKKKLKIKIKERKKSFMSRGCGGCVAKRKNNKPQR